MGAAGMVAAEIGGQLLGGVINQALGYHANKRLMKYQSELQQQLTDRANEYNLPVNQVRRLVAGGLNPNLAYSGVNSVAGSSTPSVGLNSAPSPNMKFDILGAMQQTQNIELTKQQVEHQRLENERLRKEEPYFEYWAELKNDTNRWLNMSAENKAKQDEISYQISAVIRDAQLGVTDRVYDFMGNNVDNDPKDYIFVNDSPIYRATVDKLTREGLNNDAIDAKIRVMNKSIKEMTARIKLMAKQGENIDIRNELLRLEKRMKETLGVSYSDGLGWRLLSRTLSGLGVQPEDLIGIFDDDYGKDPISRGASVGGNP